MTKQLLNFISTSRRDKDSGITNTKDVIRHELIDNIFNNFSKNERVDILTLPSVWWNFEKLLYNRFRRVGFIHTTGCERDRRIFSTASMNIPRSTKGVSYYYNEDYKCDVVRSSSVKLNCIDVFDYIQVTPHKFHFIWLDLISPLNIFIDKLIHLDKCTQSGSLLSITFLKARDGKEYIGQRQVMVTNILKSIDFEFINEIEYFDTCPMIHINYIKK